MSNEISTDAKEHQWDVVLQYRTIDPRAFIAFKCTVCNKIVSGEQGMFQDRTNNNSVWAQKDIPDCVPRG